MSVPQLPSPNNQRIQYRIVERENARSAPQSRKPSLSGSIHDMDIAPPHPPPSQPSHSSDLPTSPSRRRSTAPRPRSVMAPVDEEYWILVMGMTGSGKSSFVDLLADDKGRVRVGHSLNSTTSEVQDHRCRMANGRSVRLLDTPGFGDATRSDTDVLQTIANEMNELYNLGCRIDGAIYMHPIIDPRMSGAALKSLGIFRRICGEEYFPHIALVSTKWETLKGLDAHVTAESRERDLIDKPEFWANLVHRGSVTFRHDGSVRSAMNIVNDLLRRSEQAPLKLQLEMWLGKTLAETEAGSFVEGEVLKMKDNYEKEVERLRHELKQVKVEGDLREEESVMEQAKAAQAKIFGLKHDAASLHVDSKGARRSKRITAAKILRSLGPGETFVG